MLLNVGGKNVSGFFISWEKSEQMFSSVRWVRGQMYSIPIVDSS